MVSRFNQTISGIETALEMLRDEGPWGFNQTISGIETLLLGYH